MKNINLLFLTLFCASLFGQDCATADYYRVITIDNTSGTNLTDYQVKVELNTSELVAEGKMQADGADLRVFADDCSPLSFWADSLGTSTATDIWVKIPAIAAGGSSTLQIYYGNDSAESVADGEATFILFDDFSDSEVNTDKWEAVGEFSQFENVDGIFNYASDQAEIPGPRFKFARTKMVFTDEVIFDYVGERGNSSGFGFSSTDMPLERILFRGTMGFDTLNQVAYMQDTLSNGSQVEGFYPILPFTRNEFQSVSTTVGLNEANHLLFTRYANEGQDLENTTPYEFINTEMTGFHFILSTFSFSPSIKLDNFRVRQSTPNPPSSSVGPELIPTVTNISEQIDPKLIQVFPNPARQFSNIQTDFEEPLILEVHNALGQQLNLGTTLLVPGQSHQINLQNFSSAVYYLQFRRVSNGALVHTRRLQVVQ